MKRKNKARGNKANLERIINEKALTYLIDLRKEFKKNLVTFITGAFSFVAALLWRDVITGAINKLIPLEGNQILYKLYAAIIVTLIAVFFIYSLSKLFRTT